MGSLVLEVCGTPKAQPRPRAFGMRQKHRGYQEGVEPVAIRVYDPGTANDWKTCVRVEAQRAVAEATSTQRPPPSFPIPTGVPICCDIDFYLPRPKCLCRKCDPEEAIAHTGKPDRDNLEKAVLDALTDVGLWHSDSQVCAGEVRKFYAPKTGRGPGARIRIEWREPQ